jgi:hypothetical protein
MKLLGLYHFRACSDPAEIGSWRGLPERRTETPQRPKPFFGDEALSLPDSAVIVNYDIDSDARQGGK